MKYEGSRWVIDDHPFGGWVVIDRKWNKAAIHTMVYEEAVDLAVGIYTWPEYLLDRYEQGMKKVYGDPVGEDANER